MQVRWVAVAVLAAACRFDDGVVAPGDGATDGRANIDAPSGDGMQPGGDASQAVTSPRKLVLDGSMISSSQLLVPILIALDATRIDYGAVTNPATDLRFQDPITTLDLAFEVERWDETGTSYVWVRAPGVPAGATSSITMYFGPSVGSANPGVLWAGYNLVHHLDTALTNSVGSAYPGTAVNATFSAGKIGDAATFAASSDQRITFGSSGALFNGWTAFTFEWWLFPKYANVAAVSGEPRFMDKGGPLTLGRLFVASTEVVAQVDLHFNGGNNDVYLNTPVDVGKWNYLVYTFDGMRVRLYKNGANVATSNVLNSAPQNLINSTQQLYLGETSNPMTGQIDELRIEQTARSADWIKLQYLSMTQQVVTVTAP